MTALALAYGLCPDDRLAISSSQYAHHVRLCASEREVRDQLSDRYARGLLLDATALSRFQTAQTLPTEVVAENRTVILRTDFSPASIRVVKSVAQMNGYVRVSVRKIDSAVTEVKRLLQEESYQSAQLLLVTKCAASLPERIEKIIIGAVLLCHRHTTVSELAATCELSVGALEWRLASEHRPCARRLLGWLTAVHAIFRMDVLGWSQKRAALEGGFGATDNLATFVGRWTGYRPSALSRQGGFEAVLARFLCELNSDGAELKPPEP